MKEESLVEIEIHLLRIQHSKDDHLVTSRGQPAELSFQFIEWSKQIGNEHHETTLVDQFDDPSKRLGQIGRLSCRRLLQRKHELPQVAGTITGGKIVTNALVEAEQAHGVSLLEEEVGQSRCEGMGVVGLRPVERPKGHGTALVEQQVTA